MHQSAHCALYPSTTNAKADHSCQCVAFLTVPTQKFPSVRLHSKSHQKSSKKSSTRAQPMPKLTTPAKVWMPSTSTVNGPPLSPCFNNRIIISVAGHFNGFVAIGENEDNDGDGEYGDGNKDLDRPAR